MQVVTGKQTWLRGASTIDKVYQMVASMLVYQMVSCFFVDDSLLDQHGS